MKNIAIILPVCNECANLKRNFDKIYSAAKKLGSFEIIIAEDGSTDCTRSLAKKYARLPNVKLVTSRNRLGKGGGIKAAMSAARADVVGYMDIDLSVPLDYLEKAVRLVNEGNEIVVGSRYVSGSNIDRSPLRYSLSAAYNLMIRALFNSSVHDHQCGFKFFKGKYSARIASEITENGWFFDSELLIRAQQEGIIPYELPVAWREHKETKIRMIDVFVFIRSMMGFRLNPSSHTKIFKTGREKDSIIA